MATHTQTRRDDLRKKLISLAEEKIAAEGLAALRARDLAKAAGCSVGAIYNVCHDINGLVLQVNGRTFQRLGQQVAAAITDMEHAPARARLIALSCAYLEFAQNNFRLWSALFGVKMTSDSDVPDWYLKTMNDLFAHISGPVAEIFPDFSTEDIHLMTRGLFSSVHGIVLLGLQQRLSGKDISRMLTLLLSNTGLTK